MKTIWKYEIWNKPEQTIEIPENYIILAFQLQHGVPCIWVMVDDDPGVKKVSVTFYTVGTGHALPFDYAQYIGTYQEYDGMFVWHVFKKVLV